VTELQTASIPLLPLGDAGVVCEGDFCEIPPHHEQHVINRRVDDDRV
jgi:hypothetical protein